MTTRCGLFLLVCALMVTQGCARQLWRNPAYPAGSDQIPFDRDLYDCRRENSAQGVTIIGGTAISGMQENTSMVVQCMKARGWYRVE